MRSSGSESEAIIGAINFGELTRGDVTDVAFGNGKVINGIVQSVVVSHVSLK